jgi:hypothetical protein
MADIQELLDSLSPDVLRGQFQLPHAAWREEYVPRFLATESYQEMVDELGRFVGHVMERWFGNRVAWRPDHAKSIAVRLLNEKLGDGLNPKAGEYTAMRMCRHGDRGGIRYLLDTISQALLREKLDQYLDCVVLPRIQHLPFEENLDLARQYVATYDVLPGLSLESPASIVLRWRQVVHQHARRVLFG